MSFFTSARLFSKPQSPAQLGGYFFDLLFLFFLWSAVSSLQDLRAFSVHAPLVTIFASSFVSIGALSIYGIRVASYIAMIRRNRAPQTIEWLVTIVPFVLAIPCFVASGYLVRLDARSHDYRFCYRDTQRSVDYTFAAPGKSCPPLPTGAIPY